MGFAKCFLYLFLLGAVSFFTGRLLPKRWFRADRFPYRSFRFEKNGRIYEKLHIRKWQNKVPDMSRIFPKMTPAKRLEGDLQHHLPRMLQETCVAELIHCLNCVAGLYCLKLYPGIGGVIVVLLYVFVFNLPFVLIQRYNRPRLIRLAKRVFRNGTAERSTGETCEC